MIKRGNGYIIKGESKYFKDKYGTSHPTIIIEDTDIAVFGKPWYEMKGNPACMLFALRGVDDFIGIKHLTGTCYYGKVYHGNLGLGEVVHESELEEI